MNSLNILMLSHGTAGDVHPFVGLGVALRARGHRITLMTNGLFEELARKSGFDFVTIGTADEFHEVLQRPDIWDPIQGTRALGQLMFEFTAPQYRAIVERFEPGNTLLVASGAAFGARLAHETLGAPMVTLVLQPSLLRSVHRPPVLAGMPAIPRWFPKWGTSAIFWIVDKIGDRIFRRDLLNAFRAELGLGPVKRIIQDWWLSPMRVVGLFPEWYGMPQPDWPTRVLLTGFPMFDERAPGAPLDREVAAFLDSGDAPIVFTPGSGMMHGRFFFDAAVEACLRLGRRGMLLTRYAEQLPPTLPEHVRHFSYIPFSQVFPRAAAVVHHGGIGTTAQALAAGIPQLIMPLAYDQPDNADRLARLGVADSLRPRRFRGPALAMKLAGLLQSPAVADQCRAMARRFTGDGVIARTCDLIEETMQLPAATR